MKTLLVKLVSCVLAICLLIPVLASCDESTNTLKDSSSSTSTQQNPSNSQNSSNDTEPSGNINNGDNTNTANTEWWQNTSVTPDNSFEFAQCGEGYAIKKFVGQETDVVIPNTYNSKPIWEISDYAFAYCANIERIKIPDCIMYIENYAFYKCTALTSIQVEQGNTKFHSEGNCLIKTAEKLLIAGCNSSVIPTDGSVTSIDNYAFAEYTELTSVTIPDSVTNIGDGAFAGCAGLMSITISNSVTSIGYGTFDRCIGLSSITIPNSVISIERYAFMNCSGLTSITFENTANWYYTENESDWKDLINGTLADMSTASENAIYFKDTYKAYYWYKK